MKETHIECMKLYLKEWYFFNQNYSIKIHESLLGGYCVTRETFNFLGLLISIVR